ncbi:MAG: hypothetical protein WBM07_15100 [Chitinivibrionales bacterium]
MEQQFKRADSALSVLLERPETRMKEIAPVEDLFREALANRPEFATILRTNSKGQIVNVASRDDSGFVGNTDVSSKEWYAGPQESKRPYYGPVIQENRRSFLFWSKPILIRNSMGMSRFGGVIAAKVNLPVCFKLFAERFQGPFQILLKGKEFYYLSWDEHASYEEKPIHIPGTSGLTCRFVSNKTNETKSAISGPEPGPVNPIHNIQSKTPLPLKTATVPVALKKNIGPGLAGAAMIVAVFITGTIMVRRRKRREIPVEKTLSVVVSSQGLAKELDDAILQSLHNEALEKIPTQEMKEKVRADLMLELKKEVAENEADILRNNARAEMKEDIRMGLQKNEAKAIRAVVEKELTDSWREEIREKYHETIYKQEIENLKKIVQEKLIEKEMPLMVESYRKELSKEIRQKISDAFSGQIEKNEREELTARVRELVKEEEETIRNHLREEMNANIQQELKRQEYEVLVDNQRDQLKKRIRDEIEEKELPAIHDEILRRVSEEERRRIDTQERPGIIEAERKRLREQEAPGLREEIRATLREEELGAMHASVKTEIYAETVQALRADIQEEYKGVIDEKLDEYRKAVEKQVRGEIKGKIKSEYHGLVEYIERLSQSIGNVDALDSLSQTIILLHDEKKKYKYFNLNTAQTESLLEYLKRVQNRFNIFLDKLDEAVREMVLKINSVMNTLDNSDLG